MVRVNRNLIFVAVAIVLGVLASLLAVKYVDNQVAARTPAGAKTRPVVVPVRNIEKGQVIGEEDLSVRDVPVDLVPADVVGPEAYQQYIGQQLRSPVAKGVPLAVSSLDLVADHFSNIINAGDVATTISVDDNNSVSGLIVPGDHVDILMMVTSDEQNQRIMPLLGNVLVLATGHRAKGVQQEGEKGANFNNLTLELPPNDAQRLAMANKAGELRVILRQADSKEPFNLSSLSKADVLRISRPARKATGIEYIIGGGKS